MFKKSLKWLLGLSLWIAGFLLLNVEKSHSAVCTSEVALRNAVRSARALTGKEALSAYSIHGSKIQLTFLDKSVTRLELNPQNCEILEVEAN